MDLQAGCAALQDQCGSVASTWAHSLNIAQLALWQGKKPADTGEAEVYAVPCFNPFVSSAFSKDVDGRCAGLPHPHPTHSCKMRKSQGFAKTWQRNALAHIRQAPALLKLVSTLKLDVHQSNAWFQIFGNSTRRSSHVQDWRWYVNERYSGSDAPKRAVSCSRDKAAAGTSLWEWKTPDCCGDKEVTLTTMFNLGQRIYTPPLAKNGDIKRSAHLMAASVCTCWTHCSLSWKGKQVKTSKPILPPPSSSSLSHLSVNET